MDNTSNFEEKNTFVFLGLGLIGGSIARAIRQYRPNARIYAWDPDQLALRLAQQDGVVNGILPPPDTAEGKKVLAGNSPGGECSDDAETYFPEDTAVVFLSAPVEDNLKNLKKISDAMPEEAILTDVGSVKGPIHKAAENAGLGHLFVGGHPMAGTERSGYRNSKALLLENAYYILTPSPDCPEEKREFMHQLVADLKAIPIVLDPEEHDFTTAAISHVPHVVSAALVNLVRENDGPDGHMKLIAAGGFKDITRISSSSPDVWEQICVANGDKIGELLDEYIRELTQFRAALSGGNAPIMRSYFENARRYRESFADNAGGPIRKIYALSVEIEDQPGMIAEVALMLANRQINIRNIGITHNRENASGALRIEFHDEKAETAARFLLISKGYTVY